jgi:hypothetical protein
VNWAVHATRKPKEHENLDTVYGRWRAEAADRGVDGDTVVRQVILDQQVLTRAMVRPGTSQSLMVRRHPRWQVRW